MLAGGCQKIDVMVKILTCLIIVHTVFSVKSSQKNFRPAMDKCMSSGHKIRHTEEETTPKEGTKVGKSLVLLNKWGMDLPLRQIWSLSGTPGTPWPFHPDEFDPISTDDKQQLPLERPLKEKGCLCFCLSSLPSTSKQRHLPSFISKVGVLGTQQSHLH